jgi:two-component system chemotaxis sensor kinase CheA
MPRRPLLWPDHRHRHLNLDRVDRLINLIGELVITEAMLSQVISHESIAANSEVSAGLDRIRQLAGEIQEGVMAIRAQPLKPVFQRMERILREACDATGKRAKLVALGEATEVDKTVIERLVDPLTHMIRNSIDHGMEEAADRLARGKPADGTVTLSAAHRSGRMIIEVSDDGGGINRSRVRELAESKGLIHPNAGLTPSEIDNLLFLPGFSSKSEVSAISGRGVGLDVVRREIQSLGGRVSISSTEGGGTTFSIALPLTLAVLEGMLLDFGQQSMVLPLSAIVETLSPASATIHALGASGRMVANRGELIPIIDLAEFFALQGRADRQHDGVLIVVETDAGGRAALAADRILDQRQVVIKSLEENYGRVPGISAATILGDGRIALIIDHEELVRAARPDPLAMANI